MVTKEHEKIKNILMDIGEAFHKKSIREPTINTIRPEKSKFKDLNKKHDVAWKLEYNQWIPIEIQISGNLDSALLRLGLVHQWSLKVIVVVERAKHEEVRKLVREGHDYKDKLIILTPSEVTKASKNVKLLKKLRAKIFGYNK